MRTLNRGMTLEYGRSMLAALFCIALRMRRESAEAETGLKAKASIPPACAGCSPSRG
jgi:hypothetical protein